MSKTGDWVIREQEQRAQELLDRDLAQRDEYPDDYNPVIPALMTACTRAKDAGNLDLSRILEAVLDAYNRPDAAEALAGLARAVSGAERAEIAEGDA